MGLNGPLRQRNGEIGQAQGIAASTLARRAIGLLKEETGQVENKLVNKLKAQVRRFGFGALALSATTLFSGAAFAQNQENWQLGFTDAASPVMEEITAFNNGMLILITVITLFVVVLLGIVMVRFRAKRNPVPSKTTHNTTIEVLWTIVPVMILVGIAIPSFGLLFSQYDPSRLIDDYDAEAALNVKVTGVRWSWQYAYPDPDVDVGNVGFPYISAPVGNQATNDFDAAEPRLLEATLPLVVPVDRVVRLQITSPPGDVLHSFALPAMGVKTDAVPGRISESWFLARSEGIYYGQCSELCGKFHYAMPIEVRVVSAEQFDEWANAARGDYNAAKELLDQWEEERLAEQVAAR